MFSGRTGAGRGRSRAVVAAVLLILAVFGGQPVAEVVVGDDAGDAAGDNAGLPRFSGARAMEWLEFQCALGPRPPASEALARLRAAIAAHADSLGLSFGELCFQQQDPYAARELELCNLVISVGPAGGRRLWLAAHYDTRPFCDRDPDPERRSEALLGANDGASGVAVLLHLAELLSRQAPMQGIDLIFFDGEDSGRAGDVNGFCLGSRRLAATWKDFGSPLASGQPRGLILLDMIGRCGLQIPQEGYSLARARDWTEAIFGRAASLELDAFLPEPGQPVYDDHIPFLQAGIPAVDLIDFDFPEWHTTGDVPAICCAESLEQVGRLLVDLCYRPLAD